MERAFLATLKNRFRPSIFCFASDEAEAEFPDYRDRIQSIWPDVVRGCPVKFRVMFPQKPFEIELLQDQLIEVGSAEKSFGNGELASTVFLRKYMIDNMFMPLQFFPDIPCGVLIVIKGGEHVNTSPDCIPNWMKPAFKSIRKNSIKLTVTNMAAALSKWLVGVGLPSYEKKVKSVESAYERDWVGLRQVMSNFFGTRDDPIKANINLKMYADLQVQQGNYSAACEAYRTLISNPEIHTFAAHANICAAFSDILAGTVSDQTIECLLYAKGLSRSNANQFLLCSLTEFYVRLLLKKSPAAAISLLTSRSRSTLDVLVVPFMLHQSALCARQRHSALLLARAASGYWRLGAYPLFSLCIRKVIDDFHGVEWPLITQYACLSMLHLIARTQDNPLEVIVDVVTASRLVMPDMFFNLVKSFEIDTTFPCRFITCTLLDVHVHGFASTPIRGCEQEWNQMGERLFGAFYAGRFFDYRTLRERQCCVGEYVFVRVAIRMPTAKYDLTDVVVLTRGSAQVETTHINVAAAEVAFVEMCLMPVSPGKVQVYGLGFIWGDCMRFETTFSQCIELAVFEDVPKISLTSVGTIHEVMHLGQITKIEVIIRNESPCVLKSVCLFLSSELDARLISPEIEDICGQYRLPLLKPDESLHVVVAVRASKLGSFPVNIMFPYWSQSPPPRYEYLHLDCEVVEPDGLTIKRGLSSFRATCPEHCAALGFTGPQDDLEAHLVVLDGRTAELDFVSQENKVNRTEIDDYCMNFIDRSQLAFWYRNDSGFVCVPVGKPETNVAMILRQSGDLLFELEVKNLCKAAIENVLVQLGNGQNKDLGFVVVGKSCQRVDCIDSMGAATMTWKMVPLAEKPTLFVDLRCSLFSGSYEVFYDASRNL